MTFRISNAKLTQWNILVNARRLGSGITIGPQVMRREAEHAERDPMPQGKTTTVQLSGMSCGKNWTPLRMCPTDTLTPGVKRMQSSSNASGVE
ncbi:hypothetical protein EYF80_025781 [Liparis tanakae]|uniref:Uncharacterized protein n=1 Tax=Liparis tanakae TaxID=230148 RepID=A0A4Z2HDU9_9TELE|nr:hypothetical protein EYF80_025781 [Liparis tanakae]